MSKPKKGPEYSREREWGVILEDLQSSFRTFGEGLEDVRNGLQDVQVRLERVEEKVDRIEIDTAQIKSFLRPLTAQVSDHEKRLSTLERAPR